MACQAEKRASQRSCEVKSHELRQESAEMEPGYAWPLEESPVLIMIAAATADLLPFSPVMTKVVQKKCKCVTKTLR